MKKVYSKQELEQLSEKVFKTYPTAAKVYAREDGNIFLEENHSRLNQGDLKVYPIERSTQDVQTNPENVATQDAQDVKKDPENVASQDAPDPANINVVDAVVIQKDTAKSGKTNNNQKAKK